MESIEKYQRKIKRPFLRRLYYWQKLHKSKKNLKEEKQYYYSILTEAYEVRNQYVHAGKIIESSIIKLEKVLPHIVSMFRVTLIDQILLSNKSTNLEQIIIKLSNKGEKLIN